MTTPQRRIKSGFTADSTIGDVLDGTAVTRGLSDAGATVVVPARRPAQARKEIGDVPGVEIAELDLADLGAAAVGISRSPLREWHTFATVSTPGRSGYRMLVSRAGDWPRGPTRSSGTLPSAASPTCCR
jgi:hypothetical protein